MVEAEEIWVEKYRPKKLDEIIGQDEVVTRLKSFVEKKSLPNLLFGGPPGVGKTCAALCIAYELFGDGWRQNLLNLNASDERGIDVIRTKVKDYARTRPIGDFPYKIVYLDESDALTPDAQHALRRTMEMYTRTARFILACVSPDTKILLPGEMEMPISNMEHNLRTGTLNVDERGGNIESDTALFHVSIDPKIIGKRTLLLETTTGRKLKVTEDHLLYTPQGWKRAIDLSSGDMIAVFPHLEGTEPPNDERIIADKENFKKFLYECELGRGFNPKGPSYGKLPTSQKEIIDKRILELHLKLKDGLTAREEKIFDIIADAGCISRLLIQQKIGLSRVRVVQLLKSLEKKGYVQRLIDEDNNHIHRFKILKTGAEVLGNMADIKRKIEREFGIQISYSTVKKIISGGRKSKYHAEYILSELEGKNLLLLTYQDLRVGIIARLIGFLLGDGHITKNRTRIIFNGDEESLEEIKRDLRELGYSPSKTFSKEMKNQIRGRFFTGVTTWFNLNSRPLCSLFEFLGVPPGDKCLQKFYVPTWIKEGPRLVKREFLRGIFGSEMSAPKCKVCNFDAIVFRQNKAAHLTDHAKKFGAQMKDLLSEFNVESRVRVKRLNYRRKSGEEMVELEITLGASNQNLYNFFSQIGYAYSKSKERLGRLAAEYLRYKLNTIERYRKMAHDISVKIRSTNQPLRAIARAYGCSPDFVFNRKRGKGVHLPRNFPTFEEWRGKYAFNGASSLVWNEIVSVSECEVDKVQDIGCLNRHNFIANGVVSHNCNFSSRIIEPIQSRCAIFRFRRLTDKDIAEMLRRIAKAEKLALTPEAIKAIIYVSEGDMRRAINVLQAASALKRKVDEKAVYEVSAAARPEEVRQMLELALDGKFEEARNKLYDLLINQGLAGEDVLEQVHREVYNLKLPEPVKVKLIDKVGEFDFRLTEGASERIQLEAVLAHFALIGNRVKST